MKELAEHRTKLVQEIRGATPYERICLMEALESLDKLIEKQVEKESDNGK